MTPEVQLAARQELWRRGELKYKLDATQRKIWAAIEKGDRKFCLLCSRRLGKSYTLVVYCVSQALKRKNLRVSYAAPFARDASEIANDLMSEILEDCPPEIRPEYRVATKEYHFPTTGSVIRFAGLNAEHANQLRGRKADVFVIDELALVDDVKHVISDIALPMTMTTDGRLLFATTPARSPSHESTNLIKKMDTDGQVISFTILDNVRVSEAKKGEYLIEAGEDPIRVPDILAGLAQPESTTALREYFCQFVTDAETAVVPEFTATAQKEIVLSDYLRPPYYDAYIALDPGFTDKSGGLFGYWDFVQKKLVIEDEFLLARASTYEIAEAVKEKELALWGGKPALLRLCDPDPRLVEDLRLEHGLIFNQASRADALGGIDLVRNMVRRRELVISPNCVALIRQLRNAVWNKKASDFERTAEEGHFDLIAALRIICRGIIRAKNPFPSWYGAPGYNTHGYAGPPKRQSVFSTTPLGKKLAKKWG